MGNAVSPRLENAERSGVLQLSGLKLTKLPEEIRRLDKLRSLDISLNRLERINSWIGCLSNLKALNVDSNKLNYFPVEICRFTKLESLSANNNQLTHLMLPGSVNNFGALRFLQSVHLAMNQFTEFPIELCSSSLPIQTLDLSSNQITAIPTCISEVQAVEMNLNNNHISIMASTIADCARLKVLRLERNQLNLTKFPVELLANSRVSLLCVEGNCFEMRKFQELPGYGQYMERYTAMMKKTT